MTKQYVKPQVSELGNLVEQTLLITTVGSFRDLLFPAKRRAIRFNPF